MNKTNNTFTNNDKFTKSGPQFVFFECYSTLKIIVLDIYSLFNNGCLSIRNGESIVWWSLK